MPRKLISLDEYVGQRFGPYTLVEAFRKREPNGKLKIYWHCQCICGSPVVRGDRMLRKYQVQDPDKCLCPKPKKKKGERHGGWRGHGEISRTYFTDVRKKAEVRSLPFEISMEEIWDLFLAQDRKCALTGEPLVFPYSSHTAKQGLDEQTASLDRIDSSKGYTIDNVWWIHKDINLMKNDFTVGELIEVCRAVASRFPEENKGEGA